MRSVYCGLVALDDTIYLPAITRNGSDVPTDATSAPVYRVFGPNGLVSGATGSMSLKDSGNITDATNASPIVVTSATHGLVTGNRVTISGVGGNTAANGTFIITRISDDTFSLDGSTGSGSYTTGGSWHLSGVYQVAITPTAAGGYESGKYYDVLIDYAVSGTSYAQHLRFGVV